MMLKPVLFLSREPIEGFDPIHPWVGDDVVRVIVLPDGMVTVWEGQNHPRRILRTRGERLAHAAMTIRRHVIARGASTLDEVFKVVRDFVEAS